MDYEPRHIEVVSSPEGGARLGPRGFPRVALVDPDIPEKYHDLARYVTPSKTTMRATVGDMWAIYRLKGITFAGDQMWRLLATRYTKTQDVHFVDAIDRCELNEEQRKQIEGWLLDG